MPDDKQTLRSLVERVAVAKGRDWLAFDVARLALADYLLAHPEFIDVIDAVRALGEARAKSMRINSTEHDWRGTDSAHRAVEKVADCLFAGCLTGAEAAPPPVWMARSGLGAGAMLTNGDPPVVSTFFPADPHADYGVWLR